MAELKTKATQKNPKEFLDKVEPQQRKDDGLVLLSVFEKVTGEKAVMWGESIVGFGKYHYKSERSSQEGDWPLVGFSPRKQSLSLYLMMGNKLDQQLLKKLGKHKLGMGCLYVNKLSDIDLKVLEKLIESAYLAMKKTYS